MLPHINQGSNDRQANFNTNLNSTQDRHMIRNMTENRLQYEQEFVTQSSFDMKLKNMNAQSRSNKVIINNNNYDSRKSLELVRKDDKTTSQNKTRAEIDILGNILQENAETLTFTKHKCVQNNS